MEAPHDDTADQGLPLSEAFATYQCVRTIMEKILCLDKSYKSFYHTHAPTFPEECVCRTRVRWLGEVVLHTRPYECDNDDKSPKRAKASESELSAEDQALVDGFYGRTSSFASPESAALFRPDKIATISTVLGKRKQPMKLADDSRAAPSAVRPANRGEINCGAMAAVSVALRDLALQRPFACGGSFDLKRLPMWVVDCKQRDMLNHKHREHEMGIEVLLDAADGADQERRWRPAGTLGRPDIDALWECAVPSKFGDLRSGTDVLDEGVRRAREILPDRLRLVLPHGSSIDWEETMLGRAVLDMALSVLRPGYPCVMRLHKLNLYGAGGFFADHVDTPRDRAMIGTVVIGLPSSHAGGSLVVTHSGASFVHDFTTEEESVASWAALYGDCPHRVEPVTSGCRLTLTFDLVRQDPESQNQRLHKSAYAKAVRPVQRSSVPEETVDVMTSRLLTAVEAYCAKADASDRVDPLGIVLSHRYVGNEPTLAGLKGVDRLVADAISSVRRVQLVPVLVYRHLRTERWEYTPKWNADVVAFTTADLRYAMDPKANPKPPPIETHDFVDMVKGRLVDERHMAGSDYTGNSAAPETIGCIYSSVALLVGSPLDSSTAPSDEEPAP